MATESSHKTFSPDEKSILIKLIASKKVIEDKRTDVVSITKKKAAWEELEREFNSNSAVSKVSCDKNCATLVDLNNIIYPTFKRNMISSTYI